MPLVQKTGEKTWAINLNT